MNLARLIAAEANVDPQDVLLLRHSNTRIEGLKRAGGTIEEYSLVQPTDTRYDFIPDGKTPIKVVATVVSDKVHAVYRILGIEKTGTTRSLTSLGFRRFDIELNYPERNAKRFSAEVLQSTATGKFVTGWTNPRSAVARYGGKLFETVEIR
jgi:hypothetical protein